MEVIIDEDYYKANKATIDNLPDLKKLRIRHIHTYGICGPCCYSGPRGHMGPIGPTGLDCDNEYYIKGYRSTIKALEDRIERLTDNPSSFLDNPYETDKFEVEYFTPDIEKIVDMEMTYLERDLELQKEYLKEYLDKELSQKVGK